MSVRSLRRGSIAASRPSGTPTTYTIYADTVDGYITAAPGTADGAAGAPVGGDIYCGMNTATAYQAFLSFDTSAAAGTITAVTLSLYGINDSSTTDFTLEARLYDWGATLTGADWRGAASFGALTLAASKATSGWATTAYNAMTSQAALLSNINQAGTTRFVLESDRYRTGATPSGPEFVGFASRDTGSTTTGPKLVIEALV